MAPEYGRDLRLLPGRRCDANYLRLTGREEWRIELIEAYCRAQGLWRDSNLAGPMFTDTGALDISTVSRRWPAPSGPQDRVLLSNVDDNFNTELATGYKKTGDSDQRVAGRRQRP